MSYIAPQLPPKENEITYTRFLGTAPKGAVPEPCTKFEISSFPRMRNLRIRQKFALHFAGVHHARIPPARIEGILCGGAAKILLVR